MFSDLIKSWLGTVIRSAAATGAGALINDGLLQSSQKEQFVGAVALLFAVVWSAWQKYGHVAIVQTLLNTNSKQATVIAKANIAGKAPNAVSALILALLFVPFLLINMTQSRAADIITKAPAIVVAADPCSNLACTGWYVGAFLGGVGSNADILGSGINGSLFAGGELPGIDAGWLYWNGKLFFGAEAAYGYQINSNVAGNGNENGSFGYQIVKFGGDLSGILGSTPPVQIPSSLQQHLMAPYVLMGVVERSFATGWATGAGATFDLTPHMFLDLRYMYANYGSATAGPLTVKSENLVFIGANYKF